MKKRNLGIALLRVWLSYEVVLDHYLHVKGLAGVPNFFSLTRSLAVPCFLLLSFYLTAGRYAAGDGGWLKKRFRRLGVPYLVWPVVYAVVILSAGAVSADFLPRVLELTELKYHGCDLSLGVMNFVRSVFCGLDRSLLHQFWFHQNLLILTAAMFALLRWVVTPRYRNCTLVALMAAGFILQYSPVNLALFGGFDFSVKYSFGRLAATVPYAALALMLGFNRDRLAAIKGAARTAIALSGLFLLFFVLYSDAMPRPKGLGYQGLNLIVMALGTCAFFHYLPLEKAPAWLERGIGLLSKYCMGIYCVHLLVGYLLHAWLFPRIGVGGETFAASNLIWLASWGVCALVALIPGRFAKDLVE